MFVPLVLTIIVSYLVSSIYNRGIYIIGVKLKNLPFLIEEVPVQTRLVTAEMIMKKPVRTLPSVASV